MKKVLLFLLIASSLTLGQSMDFYSQNSTTYTYKPHTTAQPTTFAAVKVGYYNPSASDGGFVIGYEGGRRIDEVFQFGWSVDWFHASYTDKELVNKLNDAYHTIDEEINELRAKTNLHDFPIMATLTGHIVLMPRAAAYVTAGIGAEVLIISYRDFENPDESEIKGAFDFNWRLGVGAIYEIGRRSDVFVEMTYHNSQPSWEYTVETGGTKRVFERKYDMAGLMLRAGVRFYY